MEIIKKTIKQAVTTGITESCSGTCRVIIPDLTAEYCLNIALTKNNIDFGFFDAYTDIENPILTTTVGVITGESTSRLNELKKYTITEVFFDKYKQSLTPSENGVNVMQSTYSGGNGNVRYYIDNITYIDYFVNNNRIRTTYSFIGQGYNSPDFINSPIYKDPNKYNLVSKPKTTNDVFIDRQQISALDKNYKLNFIKKLSDLTTYASGRYFNIVNNT